jgi:hypothetical protein
MITHKHSNNATVKRNGALKISVVEVILPAKLLRIIMQLPWLNRITLHGGGK